MLFKKLVKPISNYIIFSLQSVILSLFGGENYRFAVKYQDLSWS